MQLRAMTPSIPHPVPDTITAATSGCLQRTGRFVAQREDRTTQLVACHWDRKVVGWCQQRDKSMVAQDRPPSPNRLGKGWPDWQAPRHTRIHWWREGAPPHRSPPSLDRNNHGILAHTRRRETADERLWSFCCYWSCNPWCPQIMERPLVVCIMFIQLRFQVWAFDGKQDCTDNDSYWSD